MSKLAALLAPLVALMAACTCEPNVHFETAYASPALADSIEICAREGACTTLCARTFAMDPGEIDSCRILKLHGDGGAEVEVTYTTYTCVGDGWATDDGWSGGDDGYEEDPCSYGACDEYPDDYPDDDYPDDDYPDDDYPDDDYPDDPPDDDPDMEV